MMERSVPRQALAPVLVELNDHQHFIRVREAQLVIDEFDRVGEKRIASVTLRQRALKAMLALDMTPEEPTFSDEPLEPSMWDETEDEERQEAELTMLIAQLEQEIQQYENPLDLAATEEGTVVPEHLLLRIVDPEKVLGHQAHEEELRRLLDTIRSLASHSQNHILVRSLQILLRDPDTSMDVPLRNIGKGRCLREVLLDMGKKLYDDSILQNGPSALPHRHAEPPLPLFALRDEELLASRGSLARNFNTAAIGPERNMLINAGRRYTEIHPFQHSHAFAERAVRRHFSLPGSSKEDDKFSVSFHPGATEAFRTFVHQCMPDWTYGDHAIISTQEYGHMTEVLRRNGDGPPNHVRAMHLNDRSSGRPKTAEELFYEFQNGVYDPEHTKLLLLSELTRFGDYPLAIGDRYHSMVELAKFMELVRDAAQIPIVIDGSQAIGRCQAFDLQRCKPDVYIGSGSKALGTGPGAFMVTRRDLATGGKFEHEPSTLPMANIVAMGIALNQLQGKNDFMRMEGNLGVQNRQLQQGLVADRMAFLTSHAIKCASEHASKVLGTLPADQAAAWEKANETDRPLHECFACRVVYPVHRNHYDYGGILVVDFPNMKGEQMATYLRSEGFETLPCLEGSRSLRLSFHYLHGKADVDDLFNAMARLHAKRLGERLRTDEPVLKATFDIPPG